MQKLFFKKNKGGYWEENYPKLIMKGKDRPTKHILKLKNGSIIRCLPCGLSGSGIRGFTIDRLTVDEAPMIPEEVWLAVDPMLLITGGVKTLIGTPHGARGYFYECYKNEHGLFKVFHANSEKVINNRPLSESWTQQQREWALNYLEKEKKLKSRKEYAQEYLGEFIRDFSQFFSDEVIAKALIGKRGGGIGNDNNFLGVDISRMGEDETVYAIIDRTDRQKMLHVENIIQKKHFLTDVAKKIIELNKLYKFKQIYLDSGGIGCGVFDYLLDYPETKRKVVAINNRSRPEDKDERFKKRILKEDLYNNLLGLMERGEIKIIDDDEIALSFKSIQYEYTVDPKALTRLKIFGDYSHCVESLIRAAWCNRDKHLNIWVR